MTTKVYKKSETPNTFLEKCSIVVGAGPHASLAHGRERLLMLLALLQLLLILFGGTVTALAVVPTSVIGGDDGFLVGIDSADGGVDPLAAIEGIQLILLNDVDELGWVVDVLGIAAVPEPLGPTAVVVHIQLVQDNVARALQELGVVDERVLWGAILAVTHGAEGVAAAIDLALPVVSLDAKVVVGLEGHLALAHIALEQPLRQGDAGGNAIFALGLQRHLFVALNVVQISLMFSLGRGTNGRKQHKNQAKNQYLLVYRENFYNFAFKVKIHHFVYD